MLVFAGARRGESTDRKGKPYVHSHPASFALLHKRLWAGPIYPKLRFTSSSLGHTERNVYHPPPTTQTRTSRRSASALPSRQRATYLHYLAARTTSRAQPFTTRALPSCRLSTRRLRPRPSRASSRRGPHHHTRSRPSSRTRVTRTPCSPPSARGPRTTPRRARQSPWPALATLLRRNRSRHRQTCCCSASRGFRCVRLPSSATRRFVPCLRLPRAAVRSVHHLPAPGMESLILVVPRPGTPSALLWPPLHGFFSDTSLASL